MLHLRPHQVAGIDALRAGIRQGHRAQLLYGPTGMGKTEVAMALMELSRDKGLRSAMVMDRIVLVDQTSKRLDKYGIDHGVQQAGHWRVKPHAAIQICSAQTLESRASKLDVDLLVVDEAHNSRKKINELIQSHASMKVVGLSASPFTKGLGNIYSNVVTCCTTQDLVADKWLVQIKVYAAKQIDMSQAKKVAGEWTSESVTEAGTKITGDIVSEWVEKTRQNFGGPVKTIVFCAGVAHGDDLCRKFAAAGFNFVNISYKDDDEFKASAIEEFSKSDSAIQGLIATDILTKGFDVPDVLCGISARPFSKSFSSHVQQMGRVMRPCEGKTYALWLDHSGNYLRFLSDWEQVYTDGPGELDDGREKAKAEPTDKEKKKATCPNCGHLFTPGSDTCMHCGYVRLRHNNVVVVPGELEAVAQRELASKKERERWYSGLVGYAQNRGYAPGWAYHKFREKFGDIKPPRVEARLPDADIAGWIKHKQIQFMKRKENTPRFGR